MIKKEASVSINYKIKSTIFDDLCAYSDSSGRSKTSIIEDALVEYLEKHKQDTEILKKYHEGKIRFVENNDE